MTAFARPYDAGAEEGTVPVPTMEEMSGNEACSGPIGRSSRERSRPGRDGDGLILHGTASGIPARVFRYSVNGARRDMGLGLARSG